MSCAQYENFQIEEDTTKTPKAFVKVINRTKSADRVAEALDLVLANGSMPA